MKKTPLVYINESVENKTTATIKKTTYLLVYDDKHAYECYKNKY